MAGAYKLASFHEKAWENEALTKDPNVKVIGEQLNSSEPMPLIKPWEEIAQNVLSTFERIYRGKSEIKKELDSFNAKAEQILNK